jgi:hypothetical protein
LRARTVLLLVVLLGAAGGAAYLSTEKTKKARPRVEVSGPGRLELLQRLLDRRAAALGKGDARALATTAAGAQRARDRRSARRVRGLGVHRVQLTLTSPPGDLRRDRIRVDAQLSYRVHGIAGRFGARQRIGLGWDGKGWRVRGVTARRGKLPWEVAPQRRIRTRHFVVWAPRSVDPAAAGLTGALEAGYERMRDVLARGRLRRRYLVVVAGDAAQARALTARIRGVASLAAITDTEVRQEGPAERVVEVASQRLLVIWPSFVSIGPEARGTVVAHELTHAAVARATSGRTPAWLVEGLALYVSADERVAEAAQLIVAGGSPKVLSLTGLSDPDVIARLGGDAQNAAYAYASAAALYIAERYGQDALLDLYDAFNEESLEGEGGDVALSDAATRRVLHVRLRRLERELREWILARGLS